MGTESGCMVYPMKGGCRYCPCWGMIWVACWQLSTEKFMGMFMYMLFMVPSGNNSWSGPWSGVPRPPSWRWSCSLFILNIATRLTFLKQRPFCFVMSFPYSK